MVERAHPELTGFKAGSPYYRQFMQRYDIANRYIQPHHTVVDIPCGVGWGTALLNGKMIYGYDIDESAINYAKLHYASDNLRFDIGNMCDKWGEMLGVGDIDVVTCLDGIEHINVPCAQYFLKDCLTLVRNYGLIIISTPDRSRGTSGNPFHEHEYELKELETMVRNCGWTIHDYCIKPGAESPVIFMIGRKHA